MTTRATYGVMDFTITADAVYATQATMNRELGHSQSVRGSQDNLITRTFSDIGPIGRIDVELRHHGSRS